MKSEKTLTFLIFFALFTLFGNVLLMNFFFKECFQKFMHNLKGSWAKGYSKPIIASGKPTSTWATFIKIDNVSSVINSDYKRLLRDSEPSVQVENVFITNNFSPAHVSDHESLLRNSEPSVQV